MFRLETESETTKLAKGINVAVSLKQLNLSYNGITADVGFAIISSINGNKAKLDKLIMENLWVNPEFHKVRVVSTSMWLPGTAPKRESGGKQPPKGSFKFAAAQNVRTYRIEFYHIT